MLNRLKYVFALAFGLILSTTAAADAELTLQPVTSNVYAIVGSLGNRTAENSANNATFGFVVTEQGVVLIDAGGTYQGAKNIHAMIQSVTDKPVVTVINTGGQDHRWMGNGYFKSLGAELIACTKAVEDQKARTKDQLFMLNQLVGASGVDGTKPVYAEITFDQNMKKVIGGVTFEMHHAGAAHTPGDSFVWLPEQQVIFTGDIVYTERMLGILDHSHSKSWVKAFETLADYSPRHVIPGHGQAATLEKAKADTYGYLMFIREAVSAFMESGGDITDIAKIDQSRYSYLLNSASLSGRNAQRVYSELEWE